MPRGCVFSVDPGIHCFRRRRCRRGPGPLHVVSPSCDWRFFFFQAEDGIRDLIVTGVQTCALPIYRVAVRQWGVEPNRYVLYVSRLEPENNAAMVIEAFRRVRTPHKLLVVGDAPYAHEYIKYLRALARRDRRIVFTGFVFGDAYRALQQNAYCYVHATEVGGTHPALLEAMGYGNCVLTLAAPENVEVVGEAGIPYADARELAAQLQRVLRDGAIVNQYRQRAQARVRERYDWERVVDEYENLFARMAGRPEPRPPFLQAATREAAHTVATQAESAARKV